MSYVNLFGEPCDPPTISIEDREIETGEAEAEPRPFTLRFSAFVSTYVVVEARTLEEARAKAEEAKSDIDLDFVEIDWDCYCVEEGDPDED